MTNNASLEDINTPSLAVRFLVCTGLVLVVGILGFVARGAEPSTEDMPRLQSGAPPEFDRPEPLPSEDELPITDADDAPFDPGLIAEFAGCGGEPVATWPTPPADWVTFTDMAGTVEFRHPADWTPFIDAGQVAAVSADGSRAFIVELVPMQDSSVPLAEVFAMMATMHPERDYRDVRAVQIGGLRGCAVAMTADEHSGVTAALPFDGGIASVTVGYDIGADSSVVDEAWAMLGSVRVSAQ